MIKNFLLSIALLFSAGLVAQTGTPSPYSFYGIGDVTFKGALENRLMGGVSVFPDSIHLNFQNPASVAGLKFTTFTLGMSYKTTKFKSNTAQDNAERAPFEYIAVGFPMGKFGASFGLMPYSSVGYKLQKLAPDGDTEGTDNRYLGTGGLNRAFVALGYKLTKKLDIGVDFNYNFGQITTRSIEFIPQAQFGSRELNESDLSGLTVNAGLMFHTKLKKKFDVFGSLVVTPETRIKSTNSRQIATISYNDETEIVIDTLNVSVANTTLRLPAKISIGGGIGIARKWLLGTEITFRQSGNLGSRFTDIANVKYENSQKYSLGGYYIPNYNSFRSYLSKVTYRAGLNYEKTGLVLNGKSIEDKAVTFGFGFPMRGTFSNINLGVEMGSRGTKAANLVQENYTNFSISLSLNDQWFVKRKYD